MNNNTDPNYDPDHQPRHAESWHETDPARLRMGQHLPVCGPDDETPEGVTWRDMPAGDEVLKRCDFFLHVRGMLPGWHDDQGRWRTTRGHSIRKRHQAGIDAEAEQVAAAIA